MLDPSTLAADLFEAILVRWQQAGVPESDALPPRQYIAHGSVGGVAADGASLVLAMPTIVMGAVDGASNTQGQRATTAGALLTHRARFVIRLLREHPGLSPEGEFPDPDVITAASGVLLRDSVRLVEACHAWAAELPVHCQVTIGNVDTVPPSGYLAGWRLTPTVGPL